MRLMDATTTLEALSVLVGAFRIFQYMKLHSTMSQFTHVFVLAGTEILFFSFMFAFTFFGKKFLSLFWTILFLLLNDL